MKSSNLLIIFLLLLFSFDANSQNSGFFEDQRNENGKEGYKSYKWTRIGNQIWMAENLKYYVPDGCLSYQNEYSYTEKFGYLYYWEAALNACPEGWHLPNDEEWEDLAEFISNDNGGYEKSEDDWMFVGKHLKSNEGWEKVWASEDEYGFSALIAGSYYLTFDSFYELSGSGWWSSTESYEEEVYKRGLSWDSNYFSRNDLQKDWAIPIRCICDNDSLPLNNVVTFSKINVMEDLNLFPNPTKNEIKIHGHMPGVIKYSIYDLNGFIVKQNSTINNTIKVDDLLQGMYLIRFDSDNKVYTEKFVKK